MNKGTSQVFMSRDCAVGELIEDLLAKTTDTVDGALYRLNNPRLISALRNTAQRGVAVRLVLDRNKYAESKATRELLSGSTIPFVLVSGRQGDESKMHHKFVLMDSETLLTGSYNWTIESERQNFENLIVVRDRNLIGSYVKEFEALWETR